MRGSEAGDAVSLRRVYAALAAAEATPEAGERYLAAHLAALQGAVVVLAVHGTSEIAGSGPCRPWPVLAHAAPELGEWAAFFALTDPKREAIRMGHRQVVTAREADDLLRDVQRFAAAVEAWLVAHSRSVSASRRAGPTSAAG